MLTKKFSRSLSPEALAPEALPGGEDESDEVGMEVLAVLGPLLL